MARRPSGFKQHDVTRALKGALQAGFHVTAVLITRDGDIQLSFGTPQAVPSSPLNPLDREFGSHGRH